jgi:hypothetical protein
MEDSGALVTDDVFGEIASWVAASFIMALESRESARQDLVKRHQSCWRVILSTSKNVQTYLLTSAREQKLMRAVVSVRTRHAIRLAFATRTTLQRVGEYHWWNSALSKIASPSWQSVITGRIFITPVHPNVYPTDAGWREIVAELFTRVITNGFWDGAIWVNGRSKEGFLQETHECRMTNAIEALTFDAWTMERTRLDIFKRRPVIYAIDTPLDAKKCPWLRDKTAPEETEETFESIIGDLEHHPHSLCFGLVVNSALPDLPQENTRTYAYDGTF